MKSIQTRFRYSIRPRGARDWTKTGGIDRNGSGRDKAAGSLAKQAIYGDAW